MHTHLKKLFCYIFLSLCWTAVHATPKYPVDISYLVTDFKYSNEDGIKICEVQHGALSAVKGDIYISGGDGVIPSKIAHFFSQFPMKKWLVGSNYMPLMNSLIANKWGCQPDLNELSMNPGFLKQTMLSPLDPFSIASYSGIVFAAWALSNDFKEFRKTFPGILFVDTAIAPYRSDKYKMNLLFNKNPELQRYKADWEIYPKKYDPMLARTIQEKMPSELYVIKPRGEFLANGVIIVKREELDRVLQTILEPKSSLQSHPDKSYVYWSRNKDKTFLIEKYYKSDYLQFSLPLSKKADALALKSGGEYHYDPTMRIVFMLKYDQGKMTYHCLGGFWKLPCKALEEEGTLNEKRITFGEPPFYRAIDPELFDEVNAQMEKAMLLLYEIILTDK